MQVDTLRKLTTAAKPILRITGARPQAWRRDVKSGSRAKPLTHEAVFQVLDEKVWKREGGVLYFTLDAQGRVRHIGESERRLKDRWRLSPMVCSVSNKPLDRKGLYHSTAWPALVERLDSEAFPLTVVAVHEADLGSILSVQEIETARGYRGKHLCQQLEQLALDQFRVSLCLWNRQ